MLHVRRLPALFLAFAFCVTAAFGQGQTFIQCGTLLDPGVSMQPLPERTVVVEAGHVKEVREGYASPPNGGNVIDLRDAYCMPGLIDSHTHLSMESKKNGYLDRFRMYPEDQALQATRYAEITLMSGFTTVRDLGGWERVDIALRDAINRGDVVGPRMFVAGTPLSITGGHGDQTSGFREDLMGIPTADDGVVDGVESAIRGTRLAIKRGADQIKVMATGGVLSIGDLGSAPQLTEEEMRAIVETARDHGRKVAAHAHGDEGMQRAIRAGVASIEHGTYMSDETMAMMKEKGVYLVPTIIAGKSVADSARIDGYFVPSVAAKALEIGPIIQDTFGKAYRAGVPIAFGTDAGVYEHGRNAKEFVYMVEAGMPPMEAIRAATVSAADLLGRSDQLGSLTPGMTADVVAVRGNPLDDVSILQHVTFVMKEGRVYKMGGHTVVELPGG